MSKNLRGLSARRGIKQSLFDEVHRIGLSLPEEREALIKKFSDDYLIKRSSFLGASSFYDFLSSAHTGKKVFICDGSACLTSGKQADLKKILAERFGNDTIGTVTCLGHCHRNSAFMFNNTTFSADNIDLLNSFLETGDFTKPEVSTGTNADFPALIGKCPDVVEYKILIKQFSSNPEGIVRELKLSGLRGRGGAGFPFHVKLKAALNADGEQKYIVCNGDEGDPGAFSDKWLLEERASLILFGMVISGMAIGADKGVIYIRGEYPESIKAIKRAVEQFERENLAGINVCGTGYNFNISVIEGAGAYICGEETSLLNSIEGLRPEVRTRPPFPAAYGLFGKPTLLSNVETFANLWFILHNGGVMFSSLGTEKSAGTKLVSLDGAFNNPGLFEVKMGTPLIKVVDEMGGGTRYPVKAFQIGGPLGGIVPASALDLITLDFESFDKAGFLLGHAGVVSIPADFPMIKYLRHLFEFTSRESCGKCFPCRLGSYHGTELLKGTIEHGEKIDMDLFSDLLETMQLGSLCALGGGLTLPVKNILQYFSYELEEYFTLRSYRQWIK